MSNFVAADLNICHVVTVTVAVASQPATSSHQIEWHNQKTNVAMSTAISMDVDAIWP